MDDLINVENMKRSYQIVEDTISSLDNKSVQMISIIGVMFTIQVTVLLEMYHLLDQYSNLINECKVFF